MKLYTLRLLQNVSRTERESEISFGFGIGFWFLFSVVFSGLLDGGIFRGKRQETARSAGKISAFDGKNRGLEYTPHFGNLK